MTSVDLGVSQAEQRLTELSAAIAAASEEAGRLSDETGPALVAALVQVREAATHAAERAREAIAKVIPESAGQLERSRRARRSRRRCATASKTKLAELDQVATRAVETAREASDRLTAQMLSIGQSAVALEAHIERTREAQMKDSGEEFARRVSLLMDSMNSASIDVQKILSDEVDDKAWNHYLKGNRGVFTRRAVRLLGGDRKPRLSPPNMRATRVPERGQSLRPRLRGDASPRARRARWRHDRGDADVQRHGQALRGAGPGGRQAALSIVMGFRIVRGDSPCGAAQL